MGTTYEMKGSKRVAINQLATMSSAGSQLATMSSAGSHSIGSMTH